MTGLCRHATRAIVIAVLFFAVSLLMSSAPRLWQFREQVPLRGEAIDTFASLTRQGESAQRGSPAHPCSDGVLPPVHVAPLHTSLAAPHPASLALCAPAANLWQFAEVGAAVCAAKGRCNVPGEHEREHQSPRAAVHGACDDDSTAIDHDCYVHRHLFRTRGQLQPLFSALVVLSLALLGRTTAGKCRHPSVGVLVVPLLIVALAGRAEASSALGQGHFHSCNIAEGLVHCWGDNSKGQLGMGDIDQLGDEEDEMDSLPFVAFGDTIPASQITGGELHTCALFGNGGVRCWGNNLYGQLGQGNSAILGDEPAEMSTVPYVSFSVTMTVTSVCSGMRHNCAVFSNGSVKCWGYNAMGQLGVGNVDYLGNQSNEMDSLRFVPFTGTAPATAVSSTLYHNCALFSIGDIVCWGWNEFGQIGVGSTHDIGDQAGDTLSVVAFSGTATATMVSSGGYHNCALFSDGGIRCWGGSGSGQLGSGCTVARGNIAHQIDQLTDVPFSGTSTPTAVSSGQSHSCALFSNGGIRCWGENEDGQLGVGNIDNLGNGPNEIETLPFVLFSGTATAISVSSGLSHNCALFSDQSIRCWGLNTNGQLGQGNVAPVGGQADETTDLEPLPFILCDPAETASPYPYFGCNDGNTVANDGCFNCRVEDGYLCDGNPSTCLVVSASCASETIEGVEECDDGNFFSGDGCSGACFVEDEATCTGEPSVCYFCGDGNFETGEDCDDGNNVANDGCSATCTVETDWYCSSDSPSVCQTCSNGIIEGTETCDDGNVSSSDGCSPICVVESGGWSCAGEPSTCSVCGDGVVGGAETCDDDNIVSGDGCSSSCAIEAGYTCSSGNPSICQGCGDGRIDGSETCDDNNNSSGDGCSSTCNVETGWACETVNGSSFCAFCGNGIVDAIEACDDGDTAGGDGCSSVCAIEPGWVCSGSPSVCKSCGNGVQEGNEACDDNNTATGDGCSNSCSIESGFTCNGSPSVCQSCGNSKIEGIEACDDGNVFDGDGCSAICAVEEGWGCSRPDGAPSVCSNCGNGSLEGDEECDDDNDLPDDGCSTTCTVDASWRCFGQPSVCAFCGNGVIESGEVCDDGNSQGGDGCSASCFIEGLFDCSREPSVCSHCGNGKVEGDETCDDGGVSNSDGCSATCSIEDGGWVCAGSPSACSLCGNGVVETGEFCDDGNIIAGDGCSSKCVITPGFECTGDVFSVCSRAESARVVSEVFPVGGSFAGGTLITMTGALLHADSGSTFCRFGGSVTVMTNQTTLRDGRDVVVCASPPLSAFKGSHSRQADEAVAFALEFVWVDGLPVAFESFTASFTMIPVVSIVSIAPSVITPGGGETITVSGGPFLNESSLPPLIVHFADSLHEPMILNSSCLTITSLPHLPAANVVLRLSNNYDATSTLALSLDAAEWTEANDTVAYEPCKAGLWSVDELAACVACDPGSFSASPDARSCQSCSFETYQPLSSATSCLPCPPNTATFNSRVSYFDCNCVAGTFNRSLVHEQGCSPCPDGAECYGSDTPPRAQPGFWTETSSDIDAVYLACSPPSACLGGTTSSCAAGYTGNKCGDCAAGFYRSAGVCKACAPHSRFMVLIFAIVVIIAVVGTVRYAGDHRSAIMTPVGLLIDYLQTTAMVLSMEAGWPARRIVSATAKEEMDAGLGDSKPGWPEAGEIETTDGLDAFQIIDHFRQRKMRP